MEMYPPGSILPLSINFMPWVNTSPYKTKQLENILASYACYNKSRKYCGVIWASATISSRLWLYILLNYATLF